MMETIISIISKEFPQYKVKDYTKYVKTRLDYIKLTKLAMLPQASDSVVVLDTNNEIVKHTYRSNGMSPHVRYVLVINKNNCLGVEVDDALEHQKHFIRRLKKTLFDDVQCAICWEPMSGWGVSCGRCMKYVCKKCLSKCVENNIEKCPCCREQMIDDTIIGDCLIQYITCNK